jgi:hypothetical protein
MEDTRLTNPEPTQVNVDTDSVLRTYSARELCRKLGVSQHAVNEYVQQGAPHSKTGKGHRYNFVEFREWMAANGKTGKPGRPWPSQQQPDENDPLLAAGESPGLERYRNAKADLAEYERDRQRGLLIPFNELEATLMVAAATIRQANERVQREYGNAPAEILNEALAEFIANADKLIGFYLDKQSSAAVGSGDTDATPPLNA